ncbi:hypothetical protein MFMK1_003589 [Metallumcola ferriviriculae]|uniref:PepSY domain-containing protein n=1 Tax=Metallumcola ferriviriculae TaxID=3039180 RepID=A0AAU0UTU1_9FIRM|nr:hypothetical protein MFMK1_003589 [Desulfitibacteraceae bacterium MK1]
MKNHLMKLTLLLLLMAMAVLTMGGTSSIQEANVFSPAQAVEAIRAGQVEKADIIAEKGSYRINAVTKDGQRFAAEVPRDTDIISLLRDNGVETSVSKAPAPPWWTVYSGLFSILFISFPFVILVLLVLILVYLRKISKGH